MDQKHKILIISRSEDESSEVIDLLDTSAYDISKRIVSADSVVEFNEPEIDVYIVILARGFQPSRGGGEYTVTSTDKLVLYISSSFSDQVRLWAFRQGASDVLVSPFTSSELQFRLERILTGDMRRFQESISEGRMLDFLKAMLEENIQVIGPSLDPLMPGGYFYPDVARTVGRTPCDVEFLERLTAEGLLSRNVTNRVRLCPVCSEMRLNYREVCPRCSSVDVLQREMIHHFPCAHIGTVESFRRGSDLVCPKCDVVLRHIGLDYEKPVGQFICQDCEYIFADSRIECQCVQCGNVCPPDQTIERPVYRYEVNSLSEQAVSEGRIGGLDLGSLLRSEHTGLYSRQYFDHELEREMTRYRRYKSEFCVLLIRIEDFDKLRTEHAAQTSEFVNSVFQAVSDRLRNLDTTCVWDVDMLAVLLSATPKEGATVVAERMHENVNKLEYLYSIQEPRISISLVAVTDEYESPDEIMTAALRDLNE